MGVNKKSLKNLQPSVHLTPGKKPTGLVWKNIRLSGSSEQIGVIEKAITEYAAQKGLRQPQAAVELLIAGHVVESVIKAVNDA